MSARSFVFILLCFLTGIRCFSQTQEEELVHSEDIYINGSIRLSSTYIPSLHFTDTLATFENLSEELNARIPLFKKINKDNGNYSTMIWTLDGGYSQPKFSQWTSQHTFIKAATGFDLLFHYREKNNWIVSARTGFAEDQTTINYARFRTYGSIVYYRRSSEHFGFLLGTGSTYNYTTRRGFPLLGMIIQPNSKNTLSIIFPLSFDYQCHPVDIFSFGFRLAPKGEQERMTSEGIDSTFKPATLKMGHFDASLTLKAHPNSKLDIALQGGIMLGNKTTVTTSRDVIRNRLEPGPFYKFSIYYRFGGRKKDKSPTGNGSDEDEVTDQILDQLDLEDISNY